MKPQLIYYLCDKETGEVLCWGDGADGNAGPMLYLTPEAAKEAYDGFAEEDRKEITIAVTYAFN